MEFKEAIQKVINERNYDMFGIVVENENEYNKVLSALRSVDFSIIGDVKIAKDRHGFPMQIYMKYNDIDGAKCTDDDNLVYFKDLTDINEVSNKMTFKELVNNWDNVKEEEIWKSDFWLLSKDFEGDIKFEHKNGYLACSSACINPNDIFILQRPKLTLNDIEVGEEFKIEGECGMFKKMLGVDNDIVYLNKTDNGCTIWNKNDFTNKFARKFL